jgi:hypothetical protein
MFSSIPAEEEATPESLLREVADLIEYHQRMASQSESLDDGLTGFLLPPKFEAWLNRYRVVVPVMGADE